MTKWVWRAVAAVFFVDVVWLVFAIVAMVMTMLGAGDVFEDNKSLDMVALSLLWLSLFVSLLATACEVRKLRDEVLGLKWRLPPLSTKSRSTSSECES